MVEHVPSSPIRWVVQQRNDYQPRPSKIEAGVDKRSASYTIPQLRGLSLSDDSAPDDEDICEACHKESNYRAMKRLTPCHVCRSLCHCPNTDPSISCVDVVSAPHSVVFRKITLSRAVRGASFTSRDSPRPTPRLVGRSLKLLRILKSRWEMGQMSQ